MRPLKILDLRDTFEVGGPGKTILETYRAVDRRNFQLHLGVFLTRHEGDDTPFIAAARAIGMPVHVIRGWNQFDPRMVWHVAQLVKRLEIDIVHSHEIKSDVITYLASMLHRVPIVTTLHGWIANTAKQRAYMAVQRRILRGFDKVIAVSAAIRDQVSGSGRPPRNLVLLHNAIVLERYQRTGRRGYVAELCGGRQRGPVLASIGRISPEKGHADLVEALGKVAARGHRFCAILAGDGPDRARLVERVQALGLSESIHFPGYVSNPERILEETDLMILPSHTEGLPNAALEALAMEVPVLATRVGGTPEVVTDGQTGQLVEPRSPDALAAAIADFLTNPQPWRAMAARGRQVVEAQFSFTTRTRTLEGMYAELVPRNAG